MNWLTKLIFIWSVECIFIFTTHSLNPGLTILSIVGIILLTFHLIKKEKMDRIVRRYAEYYTITRQDNKHVFFKLQGNEAINILEYWHIPISRLNDHELKEFIYIQLLRNIEKIREEIRLNHLFNKFKE